MDWRENLIESGKETRELLKQINRVAVLGIKTERESFQPAFYVPEYLVSVGLEVVPVPVYYPDVEEILGEKVYRRLVDIPGEIDLVDVFRRPEHINQHLDDMIEKRPAIVWFQSGIRNDEVAEKLAKTGIKVIQDRCLMVEYRWVVG